MVAPIPVNERLTVPESAIEIRAVRASGPGGQHVNKTASKIQMRVDLGALALSPEEGARVREFLKSRLDAEGRLLVASQATRDQLRNIEDAAARVAELLRAALVPPKVRKRRKPSRAAKERRREEKRRHAQRLRERRIED